jgi:hypothetical protein
MVNLSPAVAAERRSTHSFLVTVAARMQRSVRLIAASGMTSAAVRTLRLASSWKQDSLAEIAEAAAG